MIIIRVTELDHFLSIEKETAEAINIKLNLSNQKLLINYSYNIRKNIFTCLLSVQNILSLSCHEQVCLKRQK